jgi:hypothetical protein
MKSKLAALSIAAAAISTFAAPAAAGCAPGYRAVEKDGQQLCQSAFAITIEFNTRTGTLIATSSHVQRLATETQVKTVANELGDAR